MTENDKSVAVIIASLDVILTRLEQKVDAILAAELRDKAKS